MKLAWINRFDDAIIEAGSAISSLPVANLKNPQLAVKWQSAGGITTTYILADLGAQYPIECVAVLGTNLTTAGTIRIRGSNSDNTAVTGEIVDTGTLSNTLKTGYRHIYRVLAAEYTARYWRIDLTDATLDKISAGRVFLGPAWTPSKAMLFGWGVTYHDASRTTRSKGGQVYADQSFRFRSIDFTLAFMNQAEMFNNSFEIDRANGLTKDVLFIPDENGTFNSEMSIYGLVIGSLPLNHQTYQIYRQRYRIEERL